MIQEQSTWLERLRSEIDIQAAYSLHVKQQFEVMKERARFSFYEGLNPLWLMDHAERAGVYMILSMIRPKVIIEVGVHFAGSTFLFSQVAERVYSLDIRPEIRSRCGALKNVEVIIGDSKVTLPRLLQTLKSSGKSWDFALVDGDHSTEGVRKDLNALVAEKPAKRCYVVMHDSFNPDCRAGILAADWNKPWVHHVEVDFTFGYLAPHAHVYGEMWGGLALAELSPEPRPGDIIVGQTGRLLFEAALPRSRHMVK